MPYTMRISRLTVDKLGVKLYDKVSAVVAELVANAYDADATTVSVELPLGTELARKSSTGVVDHGHRIVVTDDGHGMTPEEAQAHYLRVGTDRRTRPESGARSRHKGRAVMGRKGIGKLAPFGICRSIEVLSSGGEKTSDGYLTTHFFLDFDKIMQDEDSPVELQAGESDQTYRSEAGTTVVLSAFLPKRVPNEDVFLRQLSRRFALAEEDFAIAVRDTRSGDSDTSIQVPAFDVPTMEGSRLDLSTYPVPVPDSGSLPVTGWLGLAQQAYKNEEMAGVRVYARGKIVATTRDFEQPAGYTGEFTMRSYLVGEVHADWLDADDGDDLIRTDRQGILWDSDLGQALRDWGAGLIRQIGAASKQPRRKRKQQLFMERADLQTRASERYEDETVVDAAVDLGMRIGAFASEDELNDDGYVGDLTDVILSLAPHQALIGAFRAIAQHGDAQIGDLVELFGKARIAELASYSQIADERVKSIVELEAVLQRSDPADEAELQGLIARAPWLIRPDWTVLTENQALRTFRSSFQSYYRDRHDVELDIAISFESKRPDFTLISVAHHLHIVELKAPGHSFDNDDYDRLENYLEAFEGFIALHPQLMNDFNLGWNIDLIADAVGINNTTKRRAFEAAIKNETVQRRTWVEFLVATKNANAQFLDVHDRAHHEADPE